VSGHRFHVVGTVTNRTLLGGTPNVYVTIAAAQQVVYFGRPLIQAVLINGVPRSLPSAFELRSNTQIKQASLDQLSSVASSIKNSRAFMWVIATVIVAALIYVSALERTRDFAVFKALGSSSRLLFSGLAVQAIVVALAAAVIASIISNFMTGVFAQPVDIPGNAFVYLPLSAVVVGVLASLAALRRAVSVDPAMAFAGA
jgi:putative ABC transport system permease protein